MNPTADARSKSRYFIYYPPTHSLKQIDIFENTPTEDIIHMIKNHFHLNIDATGQTKTLFVLHYNGSDLKPTWSLAELGVPPGAIIHCLRRMKQSIHMTIHCEFNKQIIELSDDNITDETTIGSLRKKLSDRIGLPLSTFYLETYDTNNRLYDGIQLFQCKIHSNGRLNLKVWRGYEEFLSACIKGFPRPFSYDDFTRNYQVQIALHIAAFYGHLELGSYALQSGGRSDYPVGEHPSRQWSNEMAVQDMPEMLKCPIHIAIERGHMKMIDLFFRQSILCTQVLHPVSGVLPYRLALSMSTLAKTRVEKQKYSHIYLYLYDKQFNLRIQLNNDSRYCSSIYMKSQYQPDAQYLSLPRYCKIIRWCERARERIWRKRGIQYDTSINIKRNHKSRGILGYKVMIDGFNNNFDASDESIYPESNEKLLMTNYFSKYNVLTSDERNKLNETKSYMKNFLDNEQKRSKSIVENNIPKSRNPPLLVQQALFGTKENKTKIAPVNCPENAKTTDAAQEIFNNLDSSKAMDVDESSPVSVPSMEISVDVYSRAQSAGARLPSFQRKPGSDSQSRKTRPMSSAHFNNIDFVPHEQQDKRSENIKAVNVGTIVSSNIKTASRGISSKLSSSINLNNHQTKIVNEHNISKTVEQSIEKAMEKMKPSVQHNLSRKMSKDVRTSHRPEEQAIINRNPVPLSREQKLKNATIKAYERHSGVSMHKVAVNCLHEASFLKQKSWIKQVKISEEMARQQFKRVLQRANYNNNQSRIDSILMPIHMQDMSDISSTCSNILPIVKVK